MNFQKMTKKQLEEHGRTIGVELDRRQTKKNMIEELNKASSTPAKKATTKKAPAKKAPAKKAPVKKAPVKKAPVKKAPVKKAKAKIEIPPAPRMVPVPPKTDFWTRIKNFFNL